MTKSTKKFLRMKSYLKRVMSPEARLRHNRKLQDWRDCQALVALGFQVLRSDEKGTYFDIPGLTDVLSHDLKKGLYESGN